MKTRKPSVRRSGNGVRTKGFFAKNRGDAKRGAKILPKAANPPIFINRAFSVFVNSPIPPPRPFLPIRLFPQSRFPCQSVYPPIHVFVANPFIPRTLAFVNPPISPNLTRNLPKPAPLKTRCSASRSFFPIYRRSKKKKAAFRRLSFQTQINVKNVFRFIQRQTISNADFATFADAKTTFRRPYGTVFARRV